MDAPAIWHNEDHSAYGDYRVRGLPYLSSADNYRAERLRQAAMLFNGKHRAYFLGERRSQFHFPEMEVQSEVVTPYICLNMLKLMSIKTADLVFGEKAKITVDDRLKRDRLDLLVKRSNVHARLHTAVVQTSWAGGSFLQSCLWRDQVYVCNVDPRQMFPEGALNPDGQYESYVQRQIASVGEGADAVPLLLETRYLRGSIERRLYQLDKGHNRGREIDLATWPGPEGRRPKVEPTGLDDNVITYVANESGGDLSLSDYDGMIESQDAITASLTQIYRILAQHSDPLLALPAECFDPDGNLRLNKFRAFAFSDADAIPKYVVNPASLDAAVKDRIFRLTAFCIQGELAQVLLGIKEGATPDSARKLQLECGNMLAKARRKSITIEPAVNRALEVSLMLDGGRAAMFSLATVPVSVEPLDGLPIDELDEATVVSTYRASGTMSVEDGVARRVRDADEAYAEVQRVKAEVAASVPDVFMNESPGEDAPAELETAA